MLRPWRMMSVVGETEACLAVNGEAMEASPSLTIGAERPSSPSFSSSISFFSFCLWTSAGVRWRLEAAGVAVMVVLELGSVVGFGFFDLVVGFVSGVGLLSGFGGGIAFSSATPTCACFKAPTSLVPSPHIKVTLPDDLKVVIINSFCSGATLANTFTYGMTLTTAEVCSNISKQSPPIQRS